MAARDPAGDSAGSSAGSLAGGLHFDPDKVAHFEAAGWRAYYERRWPRLLWLTVELCQTQFHIPFPRSLLAAYYVTRGAVAWVPIEHDDRKVLRYYEKFYQVARRYSGLRFDPGLVAQLEVRYWDDHRRLVGAADKGEFLQTLIDLHSAVFGIGKEVARESAEYRLRAADTVDGITNGWSQDVEGDWVRLEEDLRQCYRSIDRALAAQSH